MHQLAASCDGADKIEKIVLPLLQKRTLADIDLDIVLGAKTSGDKPAKFFFEETPKEREESEESKQEELTEESTQETSARHSEIAMSDVAKELERDEIQENREVVEKIQAVNVQPIREPAKIAVEPQLDVIPEHADVIVPDEHAPATVVEPVYATEPVHAEDPEGVQDVRTESVQGNDKTIDGEKEGWGWEEEIPEEEEKTEEAKPQENKKGKND